MKLKVLLPERVLLEREVDKIVAEAIDGSFGILPRHIDMVAPLVPGILRYTAGGEEAYLALDEGMLVKCGQEVLVSVRNAVAGVDLGALEETVRERFHVIDDQERRMRTALLHLELDIVRRFSELR